jgi:hypothetical protein
LACPRTEPDWEYLQFLRRVPIIDEVAQHLVEGLGMNNSMDLARAAAQNLPLSNFVICSAISHLNNMSALDAAYAESVVAGVVNTQLFARSFVRDPSSV